MLSGEALPLKSIAGPAFSNMGRFQERALLARGLHSSVEAGCAEVVLAMQHWRRLLADRAGGVAVQLPPAPQQKPALEEGGNTLCLPAPVRLRVCWATQALDLPALFIR